MTISTFNPMLTEKCREGEMVNRMLGEPGDSKSHQKRSVLPFETDWDGARRRRPKEAGDQRHHTERRPWRTAASVWGANAVHEDTITCGEMPFFPFPHTPVPFE